MEEVKRFISDIKDGVIRGECKTVRLEKNIFLDVSVSNFQYGNINVRLWIQDDRIDPTDGMEFRRLRKYDSIYSTVQSRITQMLNEINETDFQIAFEPTVRKVERAESYPDIVPSDLNVRETYSFSQFVQIRDDVSIAEAMMTNRENGMTRREVENFFENNS